MSDRYAHVIAMFNGAVWAIVPEKLAAIREVMRRRAAGERLTDAQIRGRLGYHDDEVPRRPQAARTGGVAILPLYGFLCPKANMVTEYSGGTSLEAYGRMVRQAVADQSVGSVVLDIDSPGGLTYGVEELWAEIFAARKVKRVVACVNPSAGSGAYWIATAAEEIVAAPSGDMGSIGCFTVHEDISAHLAAEGVKVEIIRAGEFKVEANPFEPLTEEARAFAQATVDACYATFLKAVAKGRGVSTAKVAKDFGQGRMLLARDAVAAGMADRLGTLEETVARLRPGGGRAGASLALGSARHLRSAARPGEAERERLRAWIDVMETTATRIDGDDAA
jgi:signal peptide peptidase SppA